MKRLTPCIYHKNKKKVRSFFYIKVLRSMQMYNEMSQVSAQYMLKLKRISSKYRKILLKLLIIRNVLLFDFCFLYW